MKINRSLMLIIFCIFFLFASAYMLYRKHTWEIISILSVYKKPVPRKTGLEFIYTSSNGWGSYKKIDTFSETITIYDSSTDKKYLLPFIMSDIELDKIDQKMQSTNILTDDPLTNPLKGIRNDSPSYSIVIQTKYKTKTIVWGGNDAPNYNLSKFANYLKETIDTKIKAMKIDKL